MEIATKALARGAVHGAAWNFATVLAERAFGFLILGLLLRVIPVRVVGLIAIASAISELARMISLSGAGEQVQAHPGDPAVEAGAFWSQCLAGVGAMALLWLAAPTLAGLYAQPALTPVLRVMAANIFLTAFLVVPSARLAANFRFRTLGLISLGSTLLGGVTALPLALSGRGIAALIDQRMVGIGFYALVVAAAARWTPPRPPSWPVLRNSFRFSWPLMQAAFVDTIAVTGYVMLVGLRVPAAELGLLRIAQRLVEVLQELAFLPARKLLLPVLVPVLAALQSEPARRDEAVSQMLDMLAMGICFVSAVCGAAAKPIVLLLFGPHWAAAAPVFGILTFMVPAACLYGVINPLLTAARRTRLIAHFAWANAGTVMLAAWFGAPFGLQALAWALAGQGVLGVALLLAALKLGLGRPLAPALSMLALPCLGLVAARLAALAALAAWPGLGLVTQLGLAGGVAAASFLLVAMLAAPARIMGMTARLRRAFLGPRPI
ncbi:MAG TPA: oligosaccharide flippase family protein [Acidocella sp.]|uniref:oligosaccharide flippase family protein n=1 Tax=Acidocella sp. TaxID=50710 RepID=UPI002B667042|nr:oligosaccharide flippase family protein [Acidocella sp.]HVE20708.1 oligosaccharide flippase family protein [Acidocella sp.]